MAASEHRTLTVIGPQPLSYGRAVRLQERLVERVLASERRENFLLLTEHPPVITIGRSGEAAEVLADGNPLYGGRAIEVVQTNRGGRVTLHAPGQLVAYPVVDLKARGCDLHRYLRDLEHWLIGVLASFGVRAVRNPPHTGVWVPQADGAGPAKIASIGIAARRWVAWHGAALNVRTDMGLFDLIVPCGLEAVRMVSMADLLGGAAPDVPEVAERAAELFAEEFGFSRVHRTAPEPAHEEAR